MGGFKPQLFYLLLQLTNVSQENLLFCPLSLFGFTFHSSGRIYVTLVESTLFDGTDHTST